MIRTVVPHATAGIPGCGGVIREVDDDFVVEELPLYEPCGEGEHLYLTVEKRGIPTLAAVRRLARALGARERDAGYAGLKDARAAAVQTISLWRVPAACAARAAGLELDGLRVLAARWHRNKLRKGHLRGNRFRIRIRDPVAGGLEMARRTLGQLERRGVPNAFGVQRFGRRGDTHLLGRALLLADSARYVRLELAGLGAALLEEVLDLVRRGDGRAALARVPGDRPDERRLVMALAQCAAGGGDFGPVLGRVDRRLRELHLSALQAELFNAVLRRRFAGLGDVLTGDLAWLHRNGAVFLVTDPSVEQARAERLEISPSGPLFGVRMKSPEGEPGRIEAEVLVAAELPLERFRAFPQLPGARRPLRVALEDPSIRALPGGDLEVAFGLPPGAYATMVLRELMKNDDEPSLASDWEAPASDPGPGSPGGRLDHSGDMA